MEYEGTLMNSVITKEKEAVKEVSYKSIYERNRNIVWHICLAFMKNSHDAEDALQETFLRMIQSEKKFDNAEHEKAWLIVTAQNVCKNMLKSWWRKREEIENHEEKIITGAYEIDSTLQVVMNLPNKYKVPMYMYYYLDYDSAEIASILHKPKSTIRNYLSKARMAMKEMLKTK